MKQYVTESQEHVNLDATCGMCFVLFKVTLLFLL